MGRPTDARRQAGRTLQRAGASIALVAVGLLAATTSPSAAAPVTYSQTGDIDIASSLPGNTGPASPYPSTITVPAGQPVVSSITVQLQGFSHTRAEHVDVLLVAPSGTSLILMSDAGQGNTSTSSATLTFSDSAASAVPQTGAIPTGTYEPSDYDPAGDSDAFPSPAPTGASTGTLSAAFNGLNPVGTWSLYVFDDQNGQQGSMTGWSLTLDGVAVNPPPVANDDTLTTDEDTPESSNVLSNDTDPDGGGLTAALDTGPSSGTLVFGANGAYTYTPNENFNGTDSFTYTISDGEGGTDGATVNITVNPVNDPPVADDDAYSTDEDVPLTVAAGAGVLVGDTDIDSGTLTAGAPSDPAGGSVTLDADGSFTYTPDADFVGTDTFTYQVSDGNSGTDTGTVTITVGGTNDPPVAADDTASVDAGATVAIAVLANDTDPDGDTLSAALGTAPARGSAACSATGCSYTAPAGDPGGAVTFTYIASDGNGGAGTATVTVTVAGVAVLPRQDSAPTTTAPTTSTTAGAAVLARTGEPSDSLVDLAQVVLGLGLVLLASGTLIRTSPRFANAPASRRR